ncbi:MAG: ATP-binding protein [Gammaproteobacteria bacterium]
MEKYFPQGIVTDKAFCNREIERKAIKASIESHEHIVLIAPRRYGKSSLIAQVLKENDFPSICIDLFFVLTQAEVTKTIMEGVSKIMGDLLPKAKSACQRIVDSVLALNPKLTIQVFGQKVEINTKQTTEKTISELLLALNQVAQKAQKSCVMVLDEFQQIGQLKENHAIEAAIRHAVERSSNVSYIFCGSKRHLLNEMFSDKSRPLYHLCDLMTIHRIETAPYQKFLNKMAKNKWDKSLDEDVILEILHLTENHPYYVNALCRRLWRHTEIVSLVEVRNTWDEYVNQQGVWIADDLSRLTLNRKKIMTAIAEQSTNAPQGLEFSKRSSLNPSGIKKAIEDLVNLDMIYQDKKGYYHVLDPAVSYFIRKHSALHP